jgi:hypothetical protein
MRIYKARQVWGYCDNCQKDQSGEIVTVIETALKNLFLCNDCLKGLNEITHKAINDGKDHIYVSSNKRVY